MCGIFGTTLALNDDQITAVKDHLYHRGPDSQGVEKFSVGDRQLTLLHTRLAIQDLSPHGHQPMKSADGRWWVTFNGEIYNHFDLRSQLSVAFRGTSDTETLIEYIARYGIDATVERLNGIFGFFAYDSQDNKGYLVRDQFGIKPVYYASEGGGLVFSSEIKPVKEVLGRAPAMDMQALDTFLSLRFTPSESTLLDSVKRLAPGHCLEIDLLSGSTSTRCYIKPTTDRFEGGLADAVLGYKEHLQKAVKRQLLADVPVGVLLSGGIDSAVIAAMARAERDQLDGYTVGFGGQHAECEIEDAKETADVLNMGHHFVTVTPEDLLDSLPRIIRQVEEPLGTTSIMPMWYLTEKAKQDVTVVLTGQGNDEPWGGYRRYQVELLLNRFPFLKSAIMRPASLASEYFHHEAIRRGLRCLGEARVAERFLQAYALFSDDERARLMPQAESSGAQAVSKINGWLDWLGDQDISDAERMMRIDTRMNLSDDLLLYGDKISMAYALEARVPMLDPELVNFIESLPLEYRTSLSKTKIAHRAMAESYLPGRIINRPKKGFQVPFSEWSKGRWREYIEANLMARDLKVYQYLDYTGVRRIWARHLLRKPDMSKQIFALLALSIWCECYL